MEGLRHDRSRTPPRPVPPPPAASPPAADLPGRVRGVSDPRRVPPHLSPPRRRLNDANGGEFRYRFVMRSENPIERYAGFLLDIDGVLVRGREPIPGAAEGLSQLKRIGRTILLTNNSTRSRRAHARRLNSLGFPVKADEIVPSSYIAARYLARKFGKAAV
ncbi:MAG TPA: hypothetical protein ENJ47_02100, partial [Candidatus Acetothermia bacterium]|nr:hypothetical protein [Candidatus Acetothermia bacterium]